MYKTKRQRKEAKWAKSKSDKGIRFFVRRGSLAVLIPSFDPVNAAGFRDNWGNNYRALFKSFKDLIKGHTYSCHYQPLVDGDWTEIK